MERLQRAAEQGHADSQFKLACARSRGKGVAQDPAEAVKWWRKAAKQGHVGSQFNPACALSNGEGVVQENRGVRGLNGFNVSAY